MPGAGGSSGACSWAGTSATATARGSASNSGSRGGASERAAEGAAEDPPECHSRTRSSATHGHTVLGEIGQPGNPFQLLAGAFVEDANQALFDRTDPRRPVIRATNATLRHESPDPSWSKESPYFLVECKNWSSKVGPSEYDRLRGTLQRRSGRAGLGLLVAVGGFTEGVRSHHDAAREKDVLIVLIGRDDLDQWVTASDPNEVLKQLHERSIAERSGV